jgi:hypothetical protein
LKQGIEQYEQAQTSKGNVAYEAIFGELDAKNQQLNQL